ncbi:MAG: menaquinone biosynthesis decarboxylase, partial [Bacteroidota bacterium]
KNHLKELTENLFSLDEFNQVKVLIYLDHTIDISDIADAVWRFSNNVDPKRDHFIEESNSLKLFSHIAFDGTRKTKELDGFEREWPNILASDEATIKRIDEIWDKLGLGKFIASPSLKYRKQLYKGGAVAYQ